MGAIELREHLERLQAAEQKLAAKLGATKVRCYSCAVVPTSDGRCPRCGLQVIKPKPAIDTEADEQQPPAEGSQAAKLAAFRARAAKEEDERAIALRPAKKPVKPATPPTRAERAKTFLNASGQLIQMSD